LVIKPPWEKWPEKKDQIIIEIDPGMAFGTGTHPSTQMCLRVLQDLILSRFHPLTILDVGTGSGILAIASLKLGGRKVAAVDTDPVAIACARKNAAANRVGGKIDFRSGSVNSLRRVFDIVVANLLPQELLGLIPALSRRVASGGSLIASGFLGRQKKEIASALAKQGLEVQHSLAQKGWSCFLLAKGRKEDEA
jgi:ribosomal protein L11 methyltransferase